MTKSIALTILVLAVCGGCAANSQQSATIPDETGDEATVSIGFGTNIPSQPGVLVLLEPTADGWQIKRLIDSREVKGRQRIRENIKQEVLYVSSSLDHVEPFFEDTSMVNGATFECTALIDKDDVYSPCHSQFMSVNAGKTVGKNFFAAITTFGLASGTHKAVNHEKIVEVLESTNLMNAVATKVQGIQHAEYIEMFQSSTSSEDFRRFVQKYAGSDPDHLVQQALFKRDEALDREMKARLAAEEAQIETARRAQTAMAAEHDMVLEFQRALEIGSETNCGPVLEIKGDLLKVYFPVRGYGNEHWVRKGRLFPAYYGCRFVNGGYEPPE